MAKTKRCPQCRTEVAADAQHCPNCPHSFFQEEGVQEERKGRSKEPLLWLAGGALFFFAAYRVLNFVISHANEDEGGTTYSAAVAGLASTAAAGGAPAAPAAGAPTAEQLAEAQVRQAVAGGRVRVVGADGTDVAYAQPSAAPSAAGEEAAVVLTAPSAPPPEQAPVKEWRLRGHIYDLVTLKPVGHAKLVFKDIELDRHFELETGADGRYRTIIPSLPGRGYAVAISHPDYAVTYLDPQTDARSKTRQERKELAQDLGHAMDAPFEVRALGRAPVETDFYLAPLDPR